MDMCREGVVDLVVAADAGEVPIEGFYATVCMLITGIITRTVDQYLGALCC